MEHIGIDVHKNSSHLCSSADGEEYSEGRLRTTREALHTQFADRLPARVLIEASTESE